MKITNLFYLFIVVNVAGTLPIMGNNSERLLMNAIETQNINQIKNLLQQPNININYTEPNMGMTPLILSIITKNPEIVKILLTANANPNIKDKVGRTALILAAEEDVPLEIVKLLLGHNANINIRDISGKNALDYAQDYDRPQLRSKTDTNSKKIVSLLRFMQGSSQIVESANEPLFKTIGK